METRQVKALKNERATIKELKKKASKHKKEDENFRFRLDAKVKETADANEAYEKDIKAYKA